MLRSMLLTIAEGLPRPNKTGRQAYKLAMGDVMSIVVSFTHVPKITLKDSLMRPAE